MKKIASILSMTMLFCLMFSITTFAGSKNSNIVPFLNVGYGRMVIDTADIHYVNDESIDGNAVEGFNFTVGLYLNDQGKQAYKERFGLETYPPMTVLFVKMRFDKENKQVYRQVYKEKVFRTTDKNDYFETGSEDSYANVTENKVWVTVMNRVCDISLNLRKNGQWVD